MTGRRPPLHPTTLNQGQGQPHRWTQSNLQTEIQSNCQTSGHAKTSQQDSFHKHLSRSKKKKEVMAKLYSHIWFVCMCLDGQWVRLCADKLSTVSVLASLIFRPRKWNHWCPRQMRWAPTTTTRVGRNHPNSIPITVRPYPPKQFVLFLSRNKKTKTYLSSWS